MIDINDSADLILNPDDAKEAADCLQLHLQTNCWLALHFWDLQLPFFKLRPKSHYLWHTCVSLRVWHLNLNLFHTFSEESFLGKIKSIATKVHGKTLIQRIFQRYLLFVAVFLYEHRN